MNAAKLERSERLRRTYYVLLSGPKTTQELQELTGSMAVHSDVAELKANGIKVLPAKYIGKSSGGRKVYLYSLESSRQHSLSP